MYTLKLRSDASDGAGVIVGAGAKAGGIASLAEEARNPPKLQRACLRARVTRVSMLSRRVVHLRGNLRWKSFVRAICIVLFALLLLYVSRYYKVARKFTRELTRHDLESARSMRTSRFSLAFTPQRLGIERGSRDPRVSRTVRAFA